MLQQMFKRKKRGGWGLVAFTVSGIVLGLVLLAQTVGTYVYVSGNLVVQQARRDAERRVDSLQRSLRRLDPDDTATLDSVLGELFLEWEVSRN